ncbi:MAG: FIST C-terminal domain-containing protein [Elusimicrobia bacterium]|nr:FIST C-terminal domain-containing protein [Elusimicrobiota bacterium]
MKWASSLSENETLENAVAECVASIQKQLEGAPPDFVGLFVSRGSANRFEEAGALVSDRLPCRTLLGCSAGGVIGDGREVEQRPAVSLVAAVLPGVEIKPFSIQEDDLPDMDASPHTWEDLVGIREPAKPQFVILADPFSVRVDNFLMGLDYAFPHATKVGGLASGAREPGENALYLNELCLRSGLAGIAITGNIELDAVVAQGCKPIGTPLRITDCEQNVLIEIDHKSPLEALQDIAETLSARDQELLRQSLFVGLATDPQKERYERGDFLVRNIVGVDRKKGFLAVGALVRKGQVVQFHLRDAKVSAEDLRLMLGRCSSQKNRTKGALLFSCLGRGQYLYGVPNHDSRLFRNNIGPVPMGGFFCNGEIGPVGGTTYLHGYTSCFGLFRPKNEA